VVGFAGVGHAFLAIKIGVFDDIVAFKARMDNYIDAIKGVPKTRGINEIYLPGELEFIKERERRQQGIPLPQKVVEDLLAIGKDTGLSLG
jgi:LDH2 family malate/lactate/ureidoglycolate dehydrogenase